MRFVHTSDWQIGKTFRFADEASQVLRDERLEAVTKLGQLARAEGAPAILVAGGGDGGGAPAARRLARAPRPPRGGPTGGRRPLPRHHAPPSPPRPFDGRAR